MATPKSDFMTQTRYALIVLLLFDTCQNVPSSVSHGLQSNAVMSDCSHLFTCLFACLFVASGCVVFMVTRGLLCRLHGQSASYIANALVDGDPSAAWRHAVQVWRPPLVLSMVNGIANSAADDAPNDDGLYVRRVES